MKYLRSCLSLVSLVSSGICFGYLIAYLVYLMTLKRITKDNYSTETPDITIDDNDLNSSKTSLFSESCHSLELSQSALSILSSGSYVSACESLHVGIPGEGKIWDDANFRIPFQDDSDSSEDEPCRDLGISLSTYPLDTGICWFSRHFIMKDILKSFMARRFDQGCSDYIFDLGLSDLTRSEIVKEMTFCVRQKNVEYFDSKEIN